MRKSLRRHKRKVGAPSLRSYARRRPSDVGDDVGAEPNEEQRPGRLRPEERRRRIFVSCRREDTAGYADRLYDDLCDHFGRSRVFRDVEAIGPGTDSARAIQNAVRSCRVLLALIGRNWLHVADAMGHRRLDDSQDLVHLEIATALKEDGALVIPVLLEDADLPFAEQLPPPLRALTRRNAVRLTDERWQHDVETLIASLETILEPPSHGKALPVVTLYRRIRTSKPLTALITVTTAAATVLGCTGGLCPSSREIPVGRP